MPDDQPSPSKDLETGTASARAKIGFTLHFHKADGSVVDVPCVGITQQPEKSDDDHR